MQSGHMPSDNSTTIVFRCDLGVSGEDFPVSGKHPVGTGHTALALRADWQAPMGLPRHPIATEVGRPGYLSPAMAAGLTKTSAMPEQRLPVTWRDRTLEFDVILPPLGVTAIRMEFVSLA